jgi:hypothetical protein
MPPPSAGGASNVATMSVSRFHVEEATVRTLDIP